MALLGLEFAPLHVPFYRRMQTLAAGAWFVIMVFGGLIGIIFSMYLILFTSYWWLTCIYLYWSMAFDNETRNRGGRRSEWMRSWRWWQYMRDYFPMTFERVPWMKLDPKKNYLFCCFPHGMLSTGPFLSFATNYAGFDDFFPYHKPHVLTLNQHFNMPFFRELAHGLGSCNSSAESINHLLSREGGGNVAALMVGGATEAFYCRPGQYKLIYEKRKGFIRLALQNGSPLVPVITFGETDLFDQAENPEGSLLRSLQECLKRYVGMALAVPIGRGFFQYNFGMVPKRKPITTLVGNPLEVEMIKNPTAEDIDRVHEEFKQCIIELFEGHKLTYLKNSEALQLEFM